MTDPSNVLIYTTPWCPFCIRAKHLLASKGVLYEEVDVQRDPRQRLEMQNKSGKNTVPQIWISGRHVGGCDELYALERQGQLDEWLSAC